MNKSEKYYANKNLKSEGLDKSGKRFIYKPGPLVDAYLKMSLRLGEGGTEELLRQSESRSLSKGGLERLSELISSTASPKKSWWSRILHNKPSSFIIPTISFSPALKPSHLGDVEIEIKNIWVKLVPEISMTISLVYEADESLVIELQGERGPAKGWIAGYEIEGKMFPGKKIAEGRFIIHDVTFFDINKAEINVQRENYGRKY